MNYGPYQKFEDSSCTMFMTEAPSSLCVKKLGGFGNFAVQPTRYEKV